MLILCQEEEGDEEDEEGVGDAWAAVAGVVD